MQNTKIEWCDHTFNPWSGCSKVSPGCAHCYAEALSRRLGTLGKWGPGATRLRTSPQNWKLPLKWNREAGLAELNFKRGVAAGAPMDRPTRPRVFCASLADWLDDEVPLDWLWDLIGLIATTPHLDWLLLTKRPENFFPRMQEVGNRRASDLWDDFIFEWTHGGHPPANVWIGTTVEDQTRADERIPLLRQIPAKVRFLSCEPLLGSINLFTAATIGPEANNGDARDYAECWLDWVICGGESGPQARPMHPDWLRSLRDQCAATGTPFLFKQWGEYREVDDGKMGLTHTEVRTIQHARRVLKDVSRPSWITAEGRHYLKMKELPEDIACRLLDRTGKKAAGRTLDGVEHNAFPTLSSPHNHTTP